MDANDRDLQQAVLVGLAEIGLPSPASNVVPQIQWRSSDLIARVRFSSMWVQRPSQKLLLTPECRYDRADRATQAAIWHWARYVVPADSLVLAFCEARRVGMPWPSGWPRPETSLSA